MDWGDGYWDVFMWLYLEGVFFILIWGVMELGMEVVGV